jgi:hypothetical protein
MPISTIGLGTAGGVSVIDLLYSTTVGSGGVATLDTGTIDTSGYQALRIDLLARTDNNGGASTRVDCFFNADQTDSNYYSLGPQQGVNSSNSAFTAATAAANAGLFTSQDADSGTGLFTAYTALVMSPGSSSVYKHSIAVGSHLRDNAAGAFRIWHEYATIWSSTSAITQIQLVPDEGGNFVEHSTFFVYGLK